VRGESDLIVGWDDGDSVRGSLTVDCVGIVGEGGSANTTGDRRSSSLDNDVTELE
jgi:hypothetical protein